MGVTGQRDNCNCMRMFAAHPEPMKGFKYTEISAWAWLMFINDFRIVGEVAGVTR